MAFNSALFFTFVCIVLLVYFLVPKRFQWVVLLVGSYFFYIFSMGKWVIFLLLTTVSIFFTGIFLDNTNEQFERRKLNLENSTSREELRKLSAQKKKQKTIILAIALLLNFTILAFLKYFNFLSENVVALFSHFSINLTAPTIGLILPIGISFYTFQAAGYIIDVYRGKIKADRNLGKFALFLSFFPQIIQGPISRYSEIADQLYGYHDFDYTRAKFGIQLILWGLFKKMVIADRMVIAVNTIFSTYQSLPGTTILLGAVLYSLQVYCDFSGGIDIARGIAQIMGIDMPENFKRPFFATSISDFWRRWHITLSSWMRDYIFYSLSLSKLFTKLGRITRKLFGNYVGKMLPTMLAMLITFTVVGIWHGASWKFVAYGFYNAFFIVLGIFFDPLLTKFFNNHNIDTKKFSWHFYQIIVTFIIVSFGRFFSRAGSFRTAIKMMKTSMLTLNAKSLISGKFLDLGLDSSQWFVLLIAISVLFVVEVFQENGVNIREKIAEQGLVFRWTIYLVALFSILIFGIYGIGFDSTNFIYMGF